MPLSFPKRDWFEFELLFELELGPKPFTTQLFEPLALLSLKE